MPLRVRFVLRAVTCGALLLPVAAPAQVIVDTARIIRPATQFPEDSLRPPIAPGRAFLASLFVPGLGQSRLGRQLPGAIYASVEAMSIVMLLKAQNDLRIARSHAAIQVVNRYRTDPSSGSPVLDEQGRLVPLDTLPNRFDAERVQARRTQVEDWIAVLAFNHLFAGADAFVAALLWDLPARVGVRHLPRGVGLGITVRW